MFTGIVRERGRVVSLDLQEEGGRLVVAAPELAAALETGDSVAVEGCCLTAVAVAGADLSFDLSKETLDCTTLGSLAPGQDVNLEPALRAGDPLGGHFVQGHVDGVGQVRSVEPEGDGVRIWIELAPELSRYCVEKGSLTVAGVSLTVAALAGDAIAVALIPYTLRMTTLGVLVPGDSVNVEVDVTAKYVERLLEEKRER